MDKKQIISKVNCSGDVGDGRFKQLQVL